MQRPIEAGKWVAVRGSRMTGKSSLVESFEETPAHSFQYFSGVRLNEGECGHCFGRGSGAFKLSFLKRVLILVIQART